MRPFRSHALLVAAALLLSAAALVACGKPRTAAATQTTPVAFDATLSDAKAVEIADQVIVAVGGEAAWAQAKQISFTETIMLDGQAKIRVHHDWDRWNGRHRYKKKDPVSQVEIMVAYELFGDLAYGEIGGKEMKDALEPIKQEAQRRIALDSFTLLLPFKLKDPGVTLKYIEERADPAAPDKPVYDVIKMSFAPGVGLTPGDVYYVVVAKDTHLVKQIEFVEQGRKDDQRIGYRFDGWQDVGGLKLSTKRQNIGYAAEAIEFTDLKITSEVNDDLFSRPIKGP